MPPRGLRRIFEMGSGILCLYQSGLSPKTPLKHALDSLLPEREKCGRLLELLPHWRESITSVLCCHLHKLVWSNSIKYILIDMALG